MQTRWSGSSPVLALHSDSRSFLRTESPRNLEALTLGERIEPMPSHKQYSPELKQRVVRTVLEWRRERDRTDCGFEEIGQRLGVHSESGPQLIPAPTFRYGRAPGSDNWRAQTDGRVLTGCAPGQRDQEIGPGFLVGGAPPSIEQRALYVEAHKSDLRGRADLLSLSDRPLYLLGGTQTPGLRLGAT